MNLQFSILHKAAYIYITMFNKSSLQTSMVYSRSCKGRFHSYQELKEFMTTKWLIWMLVSPSFTVKKDNHELARITCLLLKKYRYLSLPAGMVFQVTHYCIWPSDKHYIMYFCINVCLPFWLHHWSPWNFIWKKRCDYSTCVHDRYCLRMNR